MATKKAKEATKEQIAETIKTLIPDTRAFMLVTLDDKDSGSCSFQGSGADMLTVKEIVNDQVREKVFDGLSIKMPGDGGFGEFLAQMIMGKPGVQRKSTKKATKKAKK